MIGNSELLLLFFLFLILFGGKRLPEFARSLGLAVSEFKKASDGLAGELAVGEKKPKKRAG